MSRHQNVQYLYLTLACIVLTIIVVLMFLAGRNYEKMQHENQIDSASYMMGYEAASLYYTTQREGVKK